MVGHRAAALNKNKDAMGTLSITGKREQQHTQNTLTDEAIKYAQIIVSTTRRKRATLSRRQETERAQQPATPTKREKKNKLFKKKIYM